MTFDRIIDILPYSLGKQEKERLLTERLLELTHKHQDNCPEYARILGSTGFDPNRATNYKEIPFLPVRLFKELDLKSIPQEEIVKTMTSSGTTGQAVTGRGVTKEQIDQVFDHFMHTEENKAAGSGLDMPIVQLLVKQMGGEIDIQSEYGKGTSVWVSIPCHASVIEKKRD